MRMTSHKELAFLSTAISKDVPSGDAFAVENLFIVSPVEGENGESFCDFKLASRVKFYRSVWGIGSIIEKGALGGNKEYWTLWISSALTKAVSKNIQPEILHITDILNITPIVASTSNSIELTTNTTTTTAIVEQNANSLNIVADIRNNILDNNNNNNNLPPTGIPSPHLKISVEDRNSPASKHNQRTFSSPSLVSSSSSSSSSSTSIPQLNLLSPPSGIFNNFNGLSVILLVLLCAAILIGVLLVPQIVVLRGRVVSLEENLVRVERQLALMHAYVQVKTTTLGSSEQVNGVNDINRTSGKSSDPNHPSPQTSNSDTTTTNNNNNNNNNLSSEETPPDLKGLLNLVGIAHEFETRLSEWSSRLSEVGKSLGDVQKIIQSLSGEAIPNHNSNNKNLNLDLRVLMNPNQQQNVTSEVKVGWGSFLLKLFMTISAILGTYFGLAKLSVRA